MTYHLIKDEIDMIETRMNRADGVEESVTILEYGEYSRANFKKLRFLRSTSKKKPRLYPRAAALDTETSHNHNEEHPIGWVYQWCFELAGNYFCGRRPSELIELLKLIIERMSLDAMHKIVIYIHNASYDLYFLLDYLIEAFGDPVNMLATKPKKIITVAFECFEIKDSYVLSNRGLDKWSKDLNTVYRKAVGAIDYGEVRFQDDELTDDDWFYMVNDVSTLSECVWKEIGDGYTIQTIPLTSTGYVRSFARKEFKKDRNNWLDFVKKEYSEELYSDLDFAYMGAITHGNPDRAAEVIEAPVGHYIKHRDFRSFYPSTEMCDGVPSEPWHLLYRYSDKSTIFTVKDVKKWMKTHCLLITCIIGNISIKDEVTFPILQVNKCFKYKAPETTFVRDNGKVRKMRGRTCITITELDFYWMLRQYNIPEIKITRVYCSKRGQSPKWMRDTILNFFLGKTKYKILAKNATNKADKIAYEYDLMKSKNRLNAIYGMSSTRCVRSSFKYEYDEEMKIRDWTCDLVDIEKGLKKYFSNRNNFNDFSLGVYTTAWCRFHLLHLIADVIGYDNTLYCDTDSAFYISNDELEAKLKDLNRKNKEECIKNGNYIEYDGEIVEFMTFEDENDNITQFKYLHSKCYAYYCNNNPDDFHVTIAGVTPYWREDAHLPPAERRTREQELGSLDNLKEDFVFTHCGGTGASYVDREPCIMEVNGHEVETGKAIIISTVNCTLHELPDNDYEYGEKMED